MRHIDQKICVLFALGTHACVFAAAARADAPPKTTYAEHVRPIFQQHCFACHGQDTKKSDLALDDYDSAMVGGAGGEVLIAADLDSSRLWALVNHEDSPKMPPEQDKIPAEQLAVVKAWIEGGLLKDAGSEAKPQSMTLAAPVETTVDNRPAGEPAMPKGVLQEPVIYSDKPGAVDAVAMSPWAPLAAVAGQKQVSLYHVDSGALLGVLPYPEGAPHSIRFSRDGSLLVVGGGRDGALGNAALFDVKSGARLATLGEETDAVLAADVSPDHTLVALGGPKKVVRVYRVADGSLAYEISKHTDWITALEFSPDGKLLATADRGGGLFLWDAPRGTERADLRGHQEMVTAVSWRADSQQLASASEDDTVRLWQLSGKQTKSWGAHGGGALSVDFSRTGELVTAGRDARVKLWQADGKHIRDLHKADDAVLTARFNHTGEQVVAGDWLGNVALITTASGDAALTLVPNPPTLAMRLAEANEQLAAATTGAAAAEAALAAADKALAEAAKTQAAAAEQHAGAQGELARAQQGHATVKALVNAYHAARAKLTAMNEQRQAEAQAAAELLAAANRSNSTVQEQLAEHRSQIEQLAKQLAELKAQHDQLLAAGEQLTADAAAEAESVAEVERKLADAERAAALAAAKKDEFERAEELRREREDSGKAKAQTPELAD